MGITLRSVRTITCKIPENLDAEMEAAVEKQGISKSEFVRQAIEQTLEHQKTSAKLSAYDLMKDGCGVVKEGPTDLATHPKHLAKFGRD
jgi:Arc/MetJ-type ribon-helix-helix transcriptional regulator